MCHFLPVGEEVENIRRQIIFEARNRSIFVGVSARCRRTEFLPDRFERINGEK